MSKPDDIPQDVWDSVGKWANWYTIDPFRTMEEAVARAIMAAKAEEREACIHTLWDQQTQFLSNEYSSNQPMGSFLERFAIDECIKAIRSRT